MDLDDFVTRGLTAQDLHGGARATQAIREQLDNRVVCGGVDGRGGDLHFELCAYCGADLIA